MMKIKSTLILLIALLFVSVNLPAQQKEDFTVQFVTLGNCYTCKIRIEAKLNMVEGVSSSNYDANNDVTTVTYDDMITDTYIIMQAVADTGHDTEWFRAPDAAYNLLIGTCCEYDRTIDYDQAQVGYLTLMDLWMGHVAVDDFDYQNQITIYPSISNGKYKMDLMGIPADFNPEVQVFSITGRLVLTQPVGNDFHHEIDISKEPVGTYIMVVSNENQTLAKSKIIKQ